MCLYILTISEMPNLSFKSVMLFQLICIKSNCFFNNNNQHLLIQLFSKSFFYQTKVKGFFFPRMSFRRILLNYAVLNPDMGYCQGMSDLVAPLLTEIQDESDTFWCFVGLMENTIFISSPRDEDMERQLVRISRNTVTL